MSPSALPSSVLTIMTSNATDCYPIEAMIGPVAEVGQSACHRKSDKTLMKKAMIAADEWARINLYQRQIGEREGDRLPDKLTDHLSVCTQRQHAGVARIL